MKYVLVQTCKQCPHNTTYKSTTDGSLTFMCRLQSEDYTKREQKPTNTIPGWCPLDDFLAVSE